MDKEERVETMEICKLKGMNINNCIITKLVRSVPNAAFLENYQHDKFDKIIFALFWAVLLTTMQQKILYILVILNVCNYGCA